MCVFFYLPYSFLGVSSLQLIFPTFIFGGFSYTGPVELCHKPHSGLAKGVLISTYPRSFIGVSSLKLIFLTYFLGGYSHIGPVDL